jgi:chromosome partitioning protein
MRTIVTFSGKGGAGKTTVARELAVAFTLAGHRVAIIDADPQAGITGWYARRYADTPAMVAMPARHDLSRLTFDHLLIDLPPGVPSYVATLIEQADVVLVPCRPSPDDLSSAAAVAPSLASHKRWAFVLTQTLHRSRLTDGALRQLAALGRVAPVSLGYRQDFPVAAIDGLAAVEFPGTKSAEEVTQLRGYVDSLMGKSDVKAARR